MVYRSQVLAEINVWYTSKEQLTDRCVNVHITSRLRNFTELRKKETARTFGVMWRVERPGAKAGSDGQFWPSLCTSDEHFRTNVNHACSPQVVCCHSTPKYRALAEFNNIFLKKLVQIGGDAFSGGRKYKIVVEYFCLQTYFLNTTKIIKQYKLTEWQFYSLQ